MDCLFIIFPSSTRWNKKPDVLTLFSTWFIMTSLSLHQDISLTSVWVIDAFIINLWLLVKQGSEFQIIRRPSLICSSWSVVFYVVAPRIMLLLNSEVRLVKGPLISSVILTNVTHLWFLVLLLLLYFLDPLCMKEEATNVVLVWCTALKCSKMQPLPWKHMNFNKNSCICFEDKKTINIKFLNTTYVRSPYQREFCSLWHSMLKFSVWLSLKIFCHNWHD